MIFHVILLLAIAALSEQCKYLKFSPEHSFCKPRNAKCKIFDAKVTEEDKTLLLKLHNEYRSKIASGKEPRAGGMPPAANMLEMEWDDELADVAQKYAEQCNMTHDCDECRQVERFRVGQNLWEILSIFGKTKEEAFRRSVEDWYEEVAIFKRGLIKSLKPNAGGDKLFQKDFKRWGHLTQLIWATSYKLGCGYVQYKDVRNWFAMFLVCNYGPVGNVFSGKIYKEGKACSACPEKSHCSKTYPALCKMKS